MGSRPEPCNWTCLRLFRIIRGHVGKDRFGSLSQKRPKMGGGGGWPVIPRGLPPAKTPVNNVIRDFVKMMNILHRIT